MSHTTTVKSVKITDINALQLAIQQLKAEGVRVDLLQNAKPRMYYQNQHGNSAYVIKLHDGQYDVGLDLQADGSYVPVFDEHAGYVAKYLGAKRARKQGEESAQHALGNLLQKYAVNVAVNTAAMQGYIVESTEVDNDGNVHITLGGM